MSYLILECANNGLAVALEAQIYSAMKSNMHGRGHSTNGGITGRNARTGRNADTKQKTVRWDIVKESPDGTFYINSPTGDPRFDDWQSEIVGGIQFTEKEFPVEWEQGEA